MLARVNRPQTNGKLERFHGKMQRKQRWFETIDELIHWHDHINHTCSLTGTTLRHQPKHLQERCHRRGQQQLLMSRQERSMMWSKGRTDFGIQHA